MSVHVSARLRRQVRDRDGYRCVYCQTPEELTVTTFEIDHITPVSKGGSTTLSNLCLACPMCNGYKGAQVEGVDPQTGQSVPLYHPLHQNWLEHFAWMKNGCEIVGLTPEGRATVEVLRLNRPQVVRLRRLWQKMGVIFYES